MAIVPVHVYGNVCDVEKIDAIGAKYGLKVIYDAAHAFGVKCNGIGVGNYGDATMFSFHATKVFNSIEGGAVSFCNSDYEEKLQALKNFGIHGIEDVTLVGGNAKMDEFRAAMGLCNLRRFFECIEARKRVFMRYVERLSSFDGIQISMPAPNVEPNFAYFPVCFDEKIFGKNRDQVADQLAEQDIFARKYFYPAINNMSCYKKMPNTQPTPIAERISHQILTLPIYETLALEDVDRICDIILT